MYKVNFTQALFNFWGEPFESTTLVCSNCGQPVNTEDLTLRTVCLNALDFMLPNENVEPEERFKWFRLAMRISKLDEVELTASEVVLLKQRIGKRWRGSWVMGQAWELLEPSQEKDS